LNPQELAEAYLGALGRADLAAILQLFSDGAQVHSPLYGSMQPRDFYSALFADTAESRLKLRGVMQGLAGDGTPLVSIWFEFGWQLAGGQQVHFDVVDVLELASDGRIRVLRIIYDTVGIRPVFEGKRAGVTGGAGSLPVIEQACRYYCSRHVRAFAGINRYAYSCWIGIGHRAGTCGI
jgi:ketosteroid isomerase-like protein